MKNQIVIGKRAVAEVLKRAPERAIQLYCTKNFENAPCPVKIMTQDQLEELVHSTSHQGIALKVIDLEPRSLEDLFDAKIIVMLDSIFDPQNVGAIMRAAECFGADAIVVSKNRGCPMTPTVSKASAGASAFMPWVEVSNLAESARKLQDEGFSVIVADMDGEENIVWPEKIVLIMGSEGEGVQQLLKKRADLMVRIPMYGKIASLNVAQACAVLLDRAHR
jgi:23S rRNA (guanosine2251-2'-O)-methyltransferase